MRRSICTLIHLNSGIKCKDIPVRPAIISLGYVSKGIESWRERLFCSFNWLLTLLTDGSPHWAKGNEQPSCDLRIDCHAVFKIKRARERIKGRTGGRQNKWWSKNCWKRRDKKSVRESEWNGHWLGVKLAKNEDKR